MGWQASERQIPRVAPAGVIWEQGVLFVQPHLASPVRWRGVSLPLELGHMFDSLWEACFFAGESRTGLTPLRSLVWGLEHMATLHWLWLPSSGVAP